MMTRRRPYTKRIKKPNLFSEWSISLIPIAETAYKNEKHLPVLFPPLYPQIAPHRLKTSHKRAETVNSVRHRSPFRGGLTTGRQTNPTQYCILRPLYHKGLYHKGLRYTRTSRSAGPKGAICKCWGNVGFSRLISRCFFESLAEWLWVFCFFFFRIRKFEFEWWYDLKVVLLVSINIF